MRLYFLHLRTRGLHRARIGVALTVLVVFPRETAAQVACDREPAGAAVERGWVAYRAGALATADSAFAAARSRCRAMAGAWDGLGFVALRRGENAPALALFDSALARAPNDHDAWQGRGLALWRADRPQEARPAFVRALALAPDDSLSRDLLGRIPAPVRAAALPVRARPARTVVAARTGKRRFEVPDGAGGWKPLFIKAVNLGAALPGKHPSEFPPDDSTYERWIASLAELGANAVRVYTIHPPQFYRALARWNRAHAARPLWLLHGVWTELPPGQQEEEYDDVAWRGEFSREMERVVDLLHGHAALPPRPGHASGLYTEDVSRWVLGYIIGREWEPYSVAAYVESRRAVHDFAGPYLTVRGGNALDVWLARFADEMIGYEMQHYNSQHPMAYTNWPTLDPLHHATETTRDEEAAILVQRGEKPPETSREYDNDAIGLDAVLVKATPVFRSGVFASFHAYPYYPDFMNYDAGYAKATSPSGPSHYFGYVRELVEHHGQMPVVISEVGVPSSRGNAHRQPQGWNHGGHDERAQGEIDARLSRDIHAAGAAGLGLFALIDEWFKKNWLVIDFEVPLERNRLWLNALDAEQNYGLIAMRPGPRDSVMTIDGDGSDWRGRTPTLMRAVDAPASAPALRVDRLWTHRDEAYLYLRLDVGAIDWTRAAYLIGIDTYDAALGDRKLPRTGSIAPVGLEFALDLRGPDDARLLVDSPYNPYRRVGIEGSRPPTSMSVYNRPFQTIANAEGRWDSLWVTLNRRRFGRDGTTFPEQREERGRLRYARQQETTLADWYADTTRGLIEIRIPWGLLNVTDPSSRQVLLEHSVRAQSDVSATTEGFRFVVESYDPRSPRGGADRLPSSGSTSASFAMPPLWSWPVWEMPRWYAERKPAFDAVRAAWAQIPDRD